MRRLICCVLTVLLLLGLREVEPLEPRSDYGKVCRNSVQGRTHLLDENGFLCELANVDWETGCCQAGRAAEERYSCRTCEEETKCCEASRVPLVVFSFRIRWMKAEHGGSFLFLEFDIVGVQVYENCVGCCMKPENESERQLAMASARHKKTFAKAVADKDAFEFCR